MRVIDAHLAQEIADRELSAQEAGVVQFVLSHTPVVGEEPEVAGRWVKDRDLINVLLAVLGCSRSPAFSRMACASVGH